MASRKTAAPLTADPSETSPVALLLIDVINDFTWPGAARVLPAAVTMARKLAALKQRAARAHIPAIYVNDNFGRWRSDFKALVDHCLKDGVPGRAVAEQLLPGDDDYFVLKPMHSGFFQTTLDVLLRHLRVRTLVLTGIAGNNCVLFTAGDAYMRGYRVVVPRDCTVSNSPARNEQALAEMRVVLKADVVSSSRIDLARLKKQHT